MICLPRHASNSQPAPFLHIPPLVGYCCLTSALPTSPSQSHRTACHPAPTRSQWVVPPHCSVVVPIRRMRAGPATRRAYAFPKNLRDDISCSAPRSFDARPASCGFYNAERSSSAVSSPKLTFRTHWRAIRHGCHSFRHVPPNCWLRR